MDLIEQILGRAAAASVAVDSALAAQAAVYIGLLAKWNERLNLTGFSLASPSDAAIDRLVMEPILAAGLVPNGARVAIDVGSGGGSPALLLKMARPELRMTLVESRSRKCAFLREAIRHLGLRDTGVENQRFEDFSARHGFVDRADLVTVRAVRGESALWSGIQAVLRVGGQVLHFGSEASAQAAPPGFVVQSVLVLATSGAAISDLRRL